MKSHQSTLSTVPSRYGLLAFMLVTVSACGDATPITDDEALDEPVEAAVAPELSPDGDWLRLDGTVISTTPSSFVLDYGDETITVEADDYDITQEGLSLVAGDRVSVSGRVDSNLFASDTIEASAIYLDSLDTVFYASAVDEEEIGLAAIPSDPIYEGVDYTGWVTGEADKGFTLGSGATKISVDTSALDSPLAREGIEAGDRVYVWGDLTFAGGGDSTLIAQGLVELIDGGESATSSSGSTQS